GFLKPAALGSVGFSLRSYEGGSRNMRKSLSALTFLSLAALAILVYVHSTHAQSADWKQLFNGKDLTGWKHVGPGQMTVEDGLIWTHGGMGLALLDGGQAGQLRDPRGIQNARSQRQFWRVYSYSHRTARALDASALRLRSAN